MSECPITLLPTNGECTASVDNKAFVVALSKKERNNYSQKTGTLLKKILRILQVWESSRYPPIQTIALWCLDLYRQQGPRVFKQQGLTPRREGGICHVSSFNFPRYRACRTDDYSIFLQISRTLYKCHIKIWTWRKIGKEHSRWISGSGIKMTLHWINCIKLQGVWYHIIARASPPAAMFRKGCLTVTLRFNLHGYYRPLEYSKLSMRLYVTIAITSVPVLVSAFSFQPNATGNVYFWARVLHLFSFWSAYLDPTQELFSLHFWQLRRLTRLH